MASSFSEPPLLTPSEQRELIALARLAIERYFLAREVIENPPPGTVVSPRLSVHQGAFVSLHHGPRLRGCVGFSDPIKSLVSTVMENAVSAAIRDLRFPPVEARELPELSIEISVMSFLSEADPSTVVAGVHGLVIERGGRRGLLLPQVATEHGWDREGFLRQLCLKAGLPQDAWQAQDVRLFSFTAQVFSAQFSASAGVP
jgi:AmmeMemoRadiSam system protein A